MRSVNVICRSSSGINCAGGGTVPAVLRVGVLGEYSRLGLSGTLELSALLINNNGVAALGNLVRNVKFIIVILNQISVPLPDQPTYTPGSAGHRPGQADTRI